MTDLLPEREPTSADPAVDQVAEARARVAASGYPGRFEVDADRVWCESCHSHLSARDIRWRVVELVATPETMVVVGGIRCPICRVLGTAVNVTDLGPRRN